MALKGFLGSTVAQGLLGNMSEVSGDQLQKEYGAYLMDGESITVGFRLVRDTVIFTDKRIMSFDKQGATGQKMRVSSINLQSVYYVTSETAGFGLDDSELTVFYIATPYLKAHAVTMESKKFEFPKKYNIQELYKMLQEIAYDNYCRINEIK